MGRRLEELLRMNGCVRSHSGRRRLAGACAATLAAGAFVVSGAGSAPAAGGLPPGWMGVVATDPTLLGSPAFFAREAAIMHSSGVQTVRIPVYWAQMQPYASAGAVPAGRTGFTNVGGRPTLFGGLDTLMTTASRNGLRVLPTVLSSPAWAAVHPGDLISSPPRNPGDYAAFVAALAQRYGPRGTFWSAHPKLPALPIRAWQIWNEPNLFLFWAQKPYARSYVALLRTSRAAIKRVDPTAQIVLAGLPDRSWNALQAIYDAGGGPLFDVAAVHPYTHSPPDVLHIVAIDRRIMARNGDARKPVTLTEIGWSTKLRGKALLRGVTWNTTEAGQARNLTHVYTALARARTKMRIQSVYWFTWYAPENQSSADWEDYAGLRHRSGHSTTSKPALVAFAKVAHKLER